MAGLINKIGDALHMGGGNKEEDKNKHPEVHKAPQYDEHKPQQHQENKEGFMDKIKDKVHGGEKADTEGKKKKKEKKKKGEDGHDHGSSSSSDSD